jgi:hypothetical protein
VLDQSPQAAVAMLTNAAALPHAITADSADTLFETDGAHSGLFDALVRYDGLFVPAFSAGSLAVGVVVDRVACRGGAVCATLCDTNRAILSNCSHPYPAGASAQMPNNNPSVSTGGGTGADTGCSRGTFSSIRHQSLPTMDSVATPLFSIGRYVRDTQDGRLLIVKHLGSSDHGPPIRTVISYLDTTSTTRSERILIFCDGPTFKTGNLVDSIRHCTRANDSRFCPLCDAPPNAQCGCKLPSCRPAHPLDFSLNRQIMSIYTGDFLGTTHATFVMPTAPAGQQYVSGSLLSSMRVNGYGIGDVRHDEISSILQAFAVQLSISDAMPTRGVMPRAARITAATEETECITPDACSDETSDMDNIFASLDAVVEGSGSAMDFTLCGFSTPQVVDAVPLYAPVPDVLSVSAGEVDDCSSPSLGIESTVPKMVAANTTRAILTSTEGSSCDNVSNLRTEDRAHVANECGGLVSLGVNPFCDDERTSLQGEQQGVEAREPSTSADDQALRGIKRKMKNREAAARSNARRKAKNDMLKKGLADAKQSATELRRKETRLREENLALRRRMYAMGATRGQM